MRFWPSLSRYAAMVSLAAALSGCLPATSSNVDEDKDPHYINGRNRASSLDFNGAIDEFEKALESNPHNSAAHREIGFIYGEQMKDYAAAIYHLQQYLKFHPNAENAELTKSWIRTYKTELVKGEFATPMNVGMQRDIERLTTENATLKHQVELLQTQLGTRQVLASNQPSQLPHTVVNAPDNRGGVSVADARTAVGSREATPVRARTYTVKSGDTVTSIARDCRVKLNSLLQANPNVDPRRLKVGMTLNVPNS